MNALLLNIPPDLKLTDEQFYHLCLANRDLRLERTAQGELIIMPPTGGESGLRNADLNFQLSLWNRQTQLGFVFDSSTAFKLPNGADRSPDAAWIQREQWEALAPAQWAKFPPLCPDFVVELCSPTDVLRNLRSKMEEYIANGTRLGWLIDLQNQQVEIYRPRQDVEILQAPKTLSGEDVLPEFVLDLNQILA
ncbi:Uma2 family endonuclease [Leptolyngbya sp. FACHB-261]|uniref:Uma2 family endonuclease n=1 Tax=Leptolyngbya sp. FACHB-261 TaxID=2692806 RepID=UPI001683B3A0|nr:Uma2 family endonuclease [Leptolyngbya sp. FACHB-261]MBD2099651.1 Uma2 family endonuclease [Leptolyngbya sp. FACHB-261]